MTTTAVAKSEEVWVRVVSVTGSLVTVVSVVGWGIGWGSAVWTPVKVSMVERGAREGVLVQEWMVERGAREWLLVQEWIVERGSREGLLVQE